MEIKDLQNPKRVRDGVVCISDTCISMGKGESFEVEGEFCAECECGIPPTQLTVEGLDEINFIRTKYGQMKIAK